MATPPPARGGASWEVVAAVVVVLLAVAVAGGAAIGVRARPTPAPQPTLAEATPFPTPSPSDPAEVQRRAFAQPLAAGCSTGGAVWLFADGGQAIRFDGRLWSIPDPTLRSLSAATCRQGVATAVGAGGAIVTIDDDKRSLHADRFGTDDLRAIAPLPDGALAVGTRGTVLRQTPTDWVPIDSGITADLYGVALVAPTAWVVGTSGVSYRLVGSTWSTVPTGTAATLRTVAAPAVDEGIAAGDAGTLLRWTGTAWARVDSGTTGSLRAAAVIGAATWIVGDGGVALEVVGAAVRRVDLGTKCTLRAVFPEGPSVWVAGSDELRGGAWRVTPSGTDRWGSC